MKNKILPYKQDLYTIFCMCFCTFMLLYPVFYELPLYLFIPWIIVSSLVNFIVNLICHNHGHVPTFGLKPLNIFFDFWLSFNRGATAIFIKIIHNINHHKYEGSHEDWFSPENEGTGPKRKRPFVYIRTTVKRFREGAKAYYDQMGKSFNLQKNLENILVIALVIFVLYKKWWAFFLFLLIPWYFGNMFLVLTNLIFHKGTNPSDRFNLSYNYLSPVENLFFLNGGYHTAHHFRPNAHWSELKKIHDDKIAPHIDNRLIKKSMFGHFFKEFL